MHEFISRSKPVQQSLLSDPDLRCDVIKADRIKTPGPEQNRGTLEDTFTGISASIWAHWATGHSLFLPAHSTKNPDFLRFLYQLVENRVITEL